MAIGYVSRGPKGEAADVLVRYDGWYPTARELIGAFQETFIWALHDRPELPCWSSGRVTLLGALAIP
jgi:salicylate hydroxylase